jgi:hypothetical protein
MLGDCLTHAISDKKSGEDTGGSLQERTVKQEWIRCRLEDLGRGPTDDQEEDIGISRLFADCAENSRDFRRQ